MCYVSYQGRLKIIISTCEDEKTQNNYKNNDREQDTNEKKTWNALK